MVSVMGDGLVLVALSTVLQLFPGVVEDLDKTDVDRDGDQAIDGRVDSPRSRGSAYAYISSRNTVWVVWIKANFTNGIDCTEALDNSSNETAQYAKRPDKHEPVAKLLCVVTVVLAKGYGRNHDE